MLSRIMLLGLRPAAAAAAEAGGMLSMCSSSLCDRKHCWQQQPAAVQQQATSWPQAWLRQYSTEAQPPRDSPPALAQAKQPSSSSDPTLSSKAIALAHRAEPVQPFHQILKTVLISEKPLTSHELFARVHEQYPKVFPNRTQFKKYLKYLQRQRWVQSKPPFKGMKQGKSSDSYVFEATHVGMKVDLNAAGTRLQLAARAAADEWTQHNLPQYVPHMREGRVPVSHVNLSLAQPSERRKLLKQHVVGAGRSQQPRQDRRQAK